MNYWSCRECSHVFQVESPPEYCPSCKAKCTFRDVSCYIPECGGLDNLDYGLLGQMLDQNEEEK